MTTLRVVCLSALILGVGSVRVAEAGAPQTQEFTEVFPIAGDESRQGTLPQFDPSLGPLQSVQITWSVEVTREVLVSHDNSTATLQVDYISLGADVNITTPGIVVNTLIEDTQILVIPPDTDGPTQFLPGDLVDQGITFANAADHPLYEGLGTFDVTFDAFFIADAEPLPAGVNASAATLQAGGFVTVTYTYIPAPGAAAVLGLAGFAAARRRR